MRTYKTAPRVTLSPIGFATISENILKSFKGCGYVKTVIRDKKLVMFFTKKKDNELARKITRFSSGGTISLRLIIKSLKLKKLTHPTVKIKKDHIVCELS